MDAITKVNDLLKSLGEFALDESGACRIEHESGIQFSVNASRDADFITLYAPLLEVAADAPVAVYQHALHLNLLQTRTLGGSIAYDPATSWIVLSLSLNVDGLDEVGFGSAVSNFVPVALSLQQELASEPDDDAETAESGVGAAAEPAADERAEGFVKV